MKTRITSLLARATFLAVLGFPAAGRADQPPPPPKSEEPRSLPNVVCMDYARDTACAIGQESNVSSEPLDGLTNPNLSTMICGDPKPEGLCGTNVCGDGICTVSERGHCPADCPIPQAVDICTCTEGSCKTLTVECTQDACTAKIGSQVKQCECQGAAADARSCLKDREGRCISCTEGDAYCQSLTLRGSISSCELFRIDRGVNGSPAATSCVNGTCVFPEKGAPAAKAGTASPTSIIGAKK